MSIEYLSPAQSSDRVKKLLKHFGHSASGVFLFRNQGGTWYYTCAHEPPWLWPKTLSKFLLSDANPGRYYVWSQDRGHVVISVQSFDSTGSTSVVTPLW